MMEVAANHATTANLNYLNDLEWMSYRSKNWGKISGAPQGVSGTQPG